ncbi:eukaryotic aspartyl protease protein [Rutstroemia sp. NJR-2017a WRK4]|nr:eukaryotic aspartyl protease protein [Rutstroemia sp. NJR-2017a WRK4]
MAPGPTIKQLQFGVATSSKSLFAGIMGMSWGLGLGTGYYNIVDQLALQGITKTRAFSMDLGNVDTAAGSIIFGGVDTKKYYGSFSKNAIIPFYNSPDGFPRYWINMTSVSIRLNNQTQDSPITSPNFSLAVIMDSGSTLSYFPPSLVNAMLTYFPGYVTKGGGLYTVPCSFKTGTGTMNFGFNGKIIRIPLAQFVWFNGATCYGPVANPSEKTDAILGDTFMRGAYVVFDQDNANVHIAQAADCGTNIVPITKGVNGVPSRVGDCPVPVAT